MRVCRAVFKARLFFWKPPNQCGFPVSVYLNIDTLLCSSQSQRINNIK